MKRLLVWQCRFHHKRIGRHVQNHGRLGHIGKGELSYSDMAMLTGLAVALQTAAQPNPKAELQTTFFFLILAVCALGFFLWFIMSRFSRLP